MKVRLKRLTITVSTWNLHAMRHTYLQRSCFCAIYLHSLKYALTRWVARLNRPHSFPSCPSRSVMPSNGPHKCKEIPWIFIYSLRRKRAGHSGQCFERRCGGRRQTRSTNPTRYDQLRDALCFKPTGGCLLSPWSIDTGYICQRRAKCTSLTRGCWHVKSGRPPGWM